MECSVGEDLRVGLGWEGGEILGRRCVEDWVVLGNYRFSVRECDDGSIAE